MTKIKWVEGIQWTLKPLFPAIVDTTEMDITQEPVNLLETGIDKHQLAI